MIEENAPLDLQESDSLQLNPQILGYILSSAKWGTFLSIMGFIGTGLMAIVAIGMMFIGSNDLFPGVGQGLMGVVYLLLAALYFFPSLYLFQFSSKTKSAIKTGAESSLTEGFRQMSLMYKFVGISTIVVLSLYVIIIVGAIIVGTAF